MYITKGGGHSHRRRDQSCNRGQDAVKWSRQFWGSVKRSSSVLGHYPWYYWRSRGVAYPFAHTQIIDDQGSRAKIQCGQAVKAVFRWSKILIPVAALDTAPMGATPLTGKSPEKNWSSVVVKHQRTFMVLKITSNIRGLFKSSAVLLYHSLETFPDILYMF